MNDRLFYARYLVTITLAVVSLVCEGVLVSVFSFILANLVWNVVEYQYVTAGNIKRKREYLERIRREDSQS